MTNGGKCPATAPVRQYNVSAINVEITLNQWLDFYPGYMYTLDENLDKVRAEETKNREARDKEGFDPGAVIPGVQAQWIQPLTLRGNQGDCVKIKLTNKLEGGEDVSLHVHGSNMVVSATGAAATTTNSDTIVAKEKSGEFEWYIHPSTQEGVRQFHTFANDRCDRIFWNSTESKSTHGENCSVEHIFYCLIWPIHYFIHNFLVV